MKPEMQRVKTPTQGCFAPLAQVPPLAFLVSFSFQFTLNLNYGAKLRFELNSSSVSNSIRAPFRTRFELRFELDLSSVSTLDWNWILDKKS